jgi:phosphatidylserine/phosphatidylglycerophosphate/cardiolipin synthase-like enzyme
VRWILLLGIALRCSGVECEVYFSPKGGCTEAIVRELDRATNTILVQAYSFTSTNIARALVQAHRRGVKVSAILDKSQKKERYTSATFLKNQGIPTWIDAAHAIAHNKVIVIDGATVLTGSFNFTKAAEEKNAENLIVLRDGELARRYTTNWQAHLAHSQSTAASTVSAKKSTVRPRSKAEVPAR